MLIKRITGFTRVLNKPDNWDQIAPNTPCGALPIRDENIDGARFMVSAWEPTPEELERLNKGASVELYINAAQHPVCKVAIGQPPSDD